MHNISSNLFLMFRRTASFLYDCLLLLAVFFIVTAIAIAFNEGEAIRSPIYYLFLYLIAFFFFDWFWRHGGQTLGMRAWRIRVEDEKGQMINFRQSLIRYLTGTVLFGLTLLYAAFTGSTQALHDRMSRSRIIRFYK